MANQVQYGFENLTSVFAERITGNLIPQVNAAITATLAEHNRQLNAAMSLLAMPTTQYKTRFKTPVSARLQPVDENGRALPIRIAGHYDVAFPLQRGAVAHGMNYEAMLKMTVEDANNVMATMLTADARWMRDHMFAALYENTNGGWTYTDEEFGSLSVKGLANGDTDTYLIQTGADAGSTDTHLLAQANAIADNADDPFGTIYDELTEHPENSGDVVALIPSGLKSTVKALADFYPVGDANIRRGANQAELVGSLGVNLPGEVFGYHDSGVWLVEWKALPANYIIATTTGGERPLAMRQDTLTQLQGFNKVGERNDHPFFETQYLRKAGFGAWNRVNGLVYRIGNGSYAVPTGYANPMP